MPSPGAQPPADPATSVSTKAPIRHRREGLERPCTGRPPCESLGDDLAAGARDEGRQRPQAGPLAEEANGAIGERTVRAAGVEAVEAVAPLVRVVNANR